MVQSLEVLALNTLVRDILSMTAINDGSSRGDKCKQLSMNYGSSLPHVIGNQIVTQLCTLSPKHVSGMTLLPLFHDGTREIALCNLSAVDNRFIQELFQRCNSVSKLYFENVDMTFKFVPECVLPCADQLTNLAFPSCPSISDTDVKLILESCSNLEDVNLFGSFISDRAFNRLGMKTIQCNECGNKRHKYPRLSKLNLGGCVNITTRAVKDLVEFVGPSMRKLYLNQCTNVYASALWYLCGRFKGKEELIKGSFTPNKALVCSCHELIPNHNSVISNRRDLPGSSFTSSSSCQNENMNHGNYYPPISDKNDGIFLETHGPSAGSSSDVSLEYQLEATKEVSEQYISFLKSFLLHTTNSDESIQDLEVMRFEPEAFVNLHPDESASISDLSFQLNSIKDLISNSQHYLLNIINQSHNIDDTSNHSQFEHLSKTLISKIDTTCKIALDLLSLHSFNPESPILYSETLHEDICAFCNDILHLSAVLEKVVSEIDVNKNLRLQLFHNSIELAQLRRLQSKQKVELKIMELEILEIQSSVHPTSSLAEDRTQQLSASAETAPDIVPNLLSSLAIDNISSCPRRELDEGSVVLAFEESAQSNITPSFADANLNCDILDYDMIDDNCPELENLLILESNMLLHNSRYSHCPSCCPYAYTPRLEELDISDIKYQSEELARVLLKGFATVNQGLKLLNVSWACVDNETMEFIAEQCKDLECLSVQQCTQLCTPILESFREHNIQSLNTLGVSWIHDSDILSLVNLETAAITSLCLAESNISDIALVHLSNMETRLKLLNLNWCDEITDVGLSVVISRHAASLEVLAIRQCSIGPGTMTAISKCSNLRVLDMSTNVEITENLWTPLAISLPHIRELDISWVYGMTDEKLTLLFHHSSCLSILTIDGHKTITIAPFRRIITMQDGKQIRSAQYVPKLRFISLQYCNDIDDDELCSIVHVCVGTLVAKNYYGDEIDYDSVVKH